MTHRTLEEVLNPQPVAQKARRVSCPWLSRVSLGAASPNSNYTSVDPKYDGVQTRRGRNKELGLEKDTALLTKTNEVHVKLRTWERGTRRIYDGYARPGRAKWSPGAQVGALKLESEPWS